MTFHAEMQGHHIEDAAVEEVHDNENGTIHREEDGPEEAHEIDTSQNVVVVVAADVDPNAMHPRYYDDPIANDSVAAAHALEEVVHESCSTAAKREDNILKM